MLEQQKTDKAVELGKKFCPNYKVISKKSSKLHRAIGWFLSKIGNPSYMTQYVTTIGQSTALPGPHDAPGTWQILLHEIQHAKDAQSISNILFYILYMSPQLIGILGVLYCIAALLAVLCGASLWLLLGFVSLLFLAPVPAFGRACIELRGYTVSLAVLFWSNSLSDEEAYIEYLVGVFSGSGYFYMWPFKAFVRWYFESKLIELKTNLFVLTPYLAACKVLSKELKD